MATKMYRGYPTVDEQLVFDAVKQAMGDKQEMLVSPMDLYKHLPAHSGVIDPETYLAVVRRAGFEVYGKSPQLGLRRRIEPAPPAPAVPPKPAPVAVKAAATVAVKPTEPAFDPQDVADKAKKVQTTLAQRRIHITLPEALEVVMASFASNLPEPGIVARLAQIRIAEAGLAGRFLLIDSAVAEVVAQYHAN